MIGPRYTSVILFRFIYKLRQRNLILNGKAGPGQRPSILVATFGVFEADCYGTGSKDNADDPRHKRTNMIVFVDSTFGVGDGVHGGLGLGGLNKIA